jgi:hypothetical protein
MRRCRSCGTQLSPDAHRCWLCHMAAPPPTETVEQDTLPTVVPRDHVRGGVLARTTNHADFDPIAASILSRSGSSHGIGHRVSAYVLQRLGRKVT